MKIKGWTLAMLCCLIVLSCASNVMSKKFTEESMDSYKTFAYITDTNANPSDFNRASEVSIDEDAVSTMKERMNEEGFSSDSSNPDLVVIISGSSAIGSNLKKDSQNRGAAASSSAGNPYSAASGSGNNSKSTKKTTNSSRPFQTGNMTIEVFNNQTKELVWVGMVKNYKTDIAATNVTASMVNAIFGKFPNN